MLSCKRLLRVFVIEFALMLLPVGCTGISRIRLLLTVWNREVKSNGLLLVILFILEAFQVMINFFGVI